MYVFMVGQYSDTDNSYGRTRLNKTLFLRTFHDQYRRRQVVDQCSLWKERPLNVLPFTWVGCQSSGAIVLSRKRPDLSRTIPSFRKKERTHRMRILKILDWLLKERTQNKRKLVEENVKIRNAFLLSAAQSQSGTHFKLGTCSKSSRVNKNLFPNLNATCSPF